MNGLLYHPCKSGNLKALDIDLVLKYGIAMSERVSAPLWSFWLLFFVLNLHLWALIWQSDGVALTGWIIVTASSDCSARFCLRGGLLSFFSCELTYWAYPSFKITLLIWLLNAFLKSLQHLFQVGIASQTPRRPNVVFLEFSFLAVSATKLIFRMKWWMVSGKWWRNETNKIVE